jgi:hypothetical protein
MHVGDLARYELHEEHIGMVLQSIIGSIAKSGARGLVG